MRIKVVTEALSSVSFFYFSANLEGGTNRHQRDSTLMTLNFVLRFNCNRATIATGTKQSAKSTAHVIVLYAYADLNILSSE